MRFSLKTWASIRLQPNLCRTCWVKIRHEIMLMSVKILSTVQMLMITF